MVAVETGRHTLWSSGVTDEGWLPSRRDPLAVGLRHEAKKPLCNIVRIPNRPTLLVPTYTCSWIFLLWPFPAHYFEEGQGMKISKVLRVQPYTSINDQVVHLQRTIAHESYMTKYSSDTAARVLTRSRVVRPESKSRVQYSDARKCCTRRDSLLPNISPSHFNIVTRKKMLYQERDSLLPQTSPKHLT